MVKEVQNQSNKQKALFKKKFISKKDSDKSNKNNSPLNFKNIKKRKKFKLKKVISKKCEYYMSNNYNYYLSEKTPIKMNIICEKLSPDKNFTKQTDKENNNLFDSNIIFEKSNNQFISSFGDNKNNEILSKKTKRCNINKEDTSITHKIYRNYNKIKVVEHSNSFIDTNLTDFSNDNQVNNNKSIEINEKNYKYTKKINKKKKKINKEPAMKVNNITKNDDSKDIITEKKIICNNINDVKKGKKEGAYYRFVSQLVEVSKSPIKIRKKNKNKKTNKIRKENNYNNIYKIFQYLKNGEKDELNKLNQIVIKYTNEKGIDIEENEDEKKNIKEEKKNILSRNLSFKDWEKKVVDIGKINNKNKTQKRFSKSVEFLSKYVSYKNKILFTKYKEEVKEIPKKKTIINIKKISSEDPQQISHTITSKDPQQILPKISSKKPQHVSPKISSKEPQQISTEILSKNLQQISPKMSEKGPQHISPKISSKDTQQISPKITAEGPQQISPKISSKDHQQISSKISSQDPQQISSKISSQDPQQISPKISSKHPQQISPKISSEGLQPKKENKKIDINNNEEIIRVKLSKNSNKEIINKKDENKIIVEQTKVIKKIVKNKNEHTKIVLPINYKNIHLLATLSISIGKS